MERDIRNLGYMAWKNDLAWMEAQKGTKWNTAIKSENTNFNEALKPLKKTVDKFQKDLTSKKSHSPAWSWRGWTIDGAEFSPVQTWKYNTFKCEAWDADIDSSGKYFVACIPDPDGFERFSVDIYSIEKTSNPKKISSILHCGPQVAFLNDLIIYLGSSKDLRYDSVRSFNPVTQATRVIYTLEDPTENLELGRAQDSSVYVIVNNFVQKKLGFITSDEIRWVVNNANDIFVVSFNYWIVNNASLPGLPHDEPLEAISFIGKWAITRLYGIRTLWDIENFSVKPRLTIWGSITFDARDPSWLNIADIRYQSYVYRTNKEIALELVPHQFNCKYDIQVAPKFIVEPEVTVKGLLVTAYGAYGTPTHVGNLVNRWKPLLKNGWIVASVIVPGSGDHDIAWKEKGQRENRNVAIQKLRDTIQLLQEIYNINPSSTALYGRSAGGLLVISTAVQNPDLIGGLYVESPYVDVLRTISNPRLPLTILETKEFGISTNPTNILSTGQWSPIEHIPVKGLPKITVVARSDTGDLEVFPYEVVKWIWRMRGNYTKLDKSKVLYINNGKGHFTTSVKSRAEDLALLQEMLEKSPDTRSRINSAVRVKNRSLKYKMAPSRKNRSTRKNRKDRKNKNTPSPMMGGKNRSMMGGKSRKANRKGGRKH